MMESTKYTDACYQAVLEIEILMLEHPECQAKEIFNIVRRLKLRAKAKYAAVILFENVAENTVVAQGLVFLVQMGDGKERVYRALPANRVLTKNFSSG